MNTNSPGQLYFIKKCRSCNINKHLTGTPGKHRWVNIGFYCPVCYHSGSCVFHPEHEDLIGDAYECKKCHNYILYTNGKGTVGKGTITKDEIYFDKDYCLIRDIESNKSMLLIQDISVHHFPYIIQFDNYQKLYNKLKMSIVFS